MVVITPQDILFVSSRTKDENYRMPMKGKFDYLLWKLTLECYITKNIRID